MKLIDKDALVAEIEKIYNEDYKFLPSDIAENIQDFKDDVLRNIDTLEVKVGFSAAKHNQWKPSEDQIEALASIVDGLAKNCGEECAFDLRTLQEQLKKLREE